MPRPAAAGSGHRRRVTGARNGCFTLRIYDSSPLKIPEPLVQPAVARLCLSLGRHPLLLTPSPALNASEKAAEAPQSPTVQWCETPSSAPSAFCHHLRATAACANPLPRFAAHIVQVGRRSLLAGVLLAVTATAAVLPVAHARAGPVPARFTYWAGCEAPAYCQPATGSNLISAEAASRVEAAAVVGNSSVQAAAALPAGYSKYWGIAGELFNPAGRITDYSFAGYKQGNEALPSPPVTVNYKQFQQPGMSDTQALLAAVDWAHKQPYNSERRGGGEQRSKDCFGAAYAEAFCMHNKHKSSAADPFSRSLVRDPHPRWHAHPEPAGAAFQLALPAPPCASFQPRPSMVPALRTTLTLPSLPPVCRPGHHQAAAAHPAGRRLRLHHPQGGQPAEGHPRRA